MLARVRNHVLDRMARRKYAPTIKVDKGPNLRRLGSAYGGWTFEPSSDLERATILSCGLGEDASFDVEFAAAFNARVIIVDPTRVRSRTSRRYAVASGSRRSQPTRKEESNRLRPTI
jgi:hypothetical protein